MTPEIQERLKKISERLKKEYHAEKVILFGSYARGEETPDSDVDLLVVMPVARSKREKQLEIRQSLRGFPDPVDVIVSTPHEFEWRREIVGTIEYPADKEGKIVYARA